MLTKRGLRILFDACDIAENIFYRGCHLNEDTLSHLSAVDEKSKNLKGMKGVYVSRILKDLTMDGDISYFMPHEVQGWNVGGGILKIIQGEILGEVDEFLTPETSAVLIKPQKIIAAFDYDMIIEPGIIDGPNRWKSIFGEWLWDYCEWG